MQYTSVVLSENDQTLEGSLSSVSKPMFATKYPFFSIFRDLQDEEIAHLRTAPNSKSSQKIFKLFRIFCSNFCKHPYFSAIFIEFRIDFDEHFSGFRRILWKMLKIPQFQNFWRILTESENSDRSKIRMIWSLVYRIFQPVCWRRGRVSGLSIETSSA